MHQIGDSIELEAIILDARDGTLLRAVPAVRASAANPLAGVNRLRGQVVGALAALDDPAYEGGGAGVRSPPSYEAYLAFMRGEEAYGRDDLPQAVAEYARAAAADSAYTLPVLRMAYASFSMDKCDRVDSIGSALTHRQAPLSRFEGYYLERVRAWCRTDWDAANEAAGRMADLAPRSQFAQFAAAQSAAHTNRPREALRRLRAVDPADGRVLGGSLYWLIYVISLHMAGENAELQLADRRLTNLARDEFTVGARAYAAGVLGRVEGVERAATDMFEMTAVSEYNDLVFVLLGLDELRAHGHGAESRRLSARLAAQTGAIAAPGPAGDTARYLQAELLYRAERYAEARPIIDSLMVRYGGHWLVLGLLGRTAARTGDVERARWVDDSLAHLTDPALRGSNFFGRAQIAAILGERDRAVRLLLEARAKGVAFVFDRDISYIRHADMDLESVLDHPTMAMLLKPKG